MKSRRIFGVRLPSNRLLLDPRRRLAISYARFNHGVHAMRQSDHLTPRRHLSHSWNDRSRGGFTLIELLVVIAIVGLLVGLLLPAVQAAREAARRTQCSNQLRQVTLAFHNHQVQFKHLPSGGWRFDTPPTYVDGNPVIGSEQQAGWAFQILPFIEATSAWQAGVEESIGLPTSTYFCPSRRSSQTVTVPDNYSPPLTGGNIKHALIDYAASNRDGSGVVRRFNPRKMRDILDGASTTLLVAEKRLNITFVGSPQNDDNEGYTAGWNTDTMRSTVKPPLPDLTGLGDGDDRFGSSHPGLFYIGLADGSCRTVTYSIDEDLFRRLGDIQDGSVIESF
ncbi:MAG: DUF1559 domain-containing protein [Planctomycetales bacterium]|nr:DUF1559 domain-containing protein [Planctomycetales bacterium]